MSIRETFYQNLQEARERLDEVSKELAKRAEDKAAKKFYDKYDSTTDLRKKAIKSKKKEDIEAAKEEEGKMHKVGKQAAKFQKYAAKKKMNEEEQLDEVNKKSIIGKFLRGREATAKGYGTFGKAITANTNDQAKKHIRNANRYYNLTTGTATTPKGFPKSTTK